MLYQLSTVRAGFCAVWFQILLAVAESELGGSRTILSSVRVLTLDHSAEMRVLQIFYLLLETINLILIRLIKISIIPHALTNTTNDANTFPHSTFFSQVTNGVMIYSWQ